MEKVEATRALARAACVQKRGDVSFSSLSHLFPTESLPHTLSVCLKNKTKPHDKGVSSLFRPVHFAKIWGLQGPCRLGLSDASG